MEIAELQKFRDMERQKKDWQGLANTYQAFWQNAEEEVEELKNCIKRHMISGIVRENLDEDQQEIMILRLSESLVTHKKMLSDLGRK